MPHPKSIEIVNPCNGYARTSYRRAQKFIARGWAHLTPDGRLEFIQHIRDSSGHYRAVCHSPNFDVRQFPVDLHYQDGRAVLKFWPDQRSDS